MGTFRKIGNIFGNYWKRSLKKHEKVFEEIRSKFGVTSKKFGETKGNIEKISNAITVENI